MKSIKLHMDTSHPFPVKLCEKYTSRDFQSTMTADTMSAPNELREERKYHDTNAAYALPNE